MIYYFKKYPLAIVIIAIIFYLSFFTPPKTELSEISNIDKFVHLAMYGGLCIIIWFEYLRCHSSLNWIRITIGAIIGPICMSGAIELIQAYLTTNRSGEWMDFASNITGVILATLAGYSF
jgi:hypothetical protein